MLLSKIKRLSTFSKLSLFTGVLLLVAVFATVSFSLHQQEMRSRASEIIPTVCPDSGTDASGSAGNCLIPPTEPDMSPTIEPIISIASTVSATLAPTSTLEVTPTVTPILTLTTTPLSTITLIPTLTPSPTIVPDTYFNFDVLLHGIGRGGDNANAKATGNMNPIHKPLTILVDVFNNQNQLVVSKRGNLSYASESGYFSGTIDMGNALPSGEYLVKIKADKYLRTSVPGIVFVKAGKSNTVAKVALVSGDVNGDNVINILDYNMVMGCYSDLKPAKGCTNSMSTDLTDDGFVNQFDYNLFLREMTTRGGE